jgi:hypothetical protein
MTGQDNGGGYYRASQGTTANFINTSDILITLCLKHLFFSKGWHLEIIYQHLCNLF